MVSNEKSYFVPDPELIVKDRPLPYPLYINSSVVLGREHYVRVVAKGDSLTDADWDLLKAKYAQVYLSELDRGQYLKAACRYLGKSESEQVHILKDSAISHLDHLFEMRSGHDLSVDIINQTLEGCRQTVEGFVDLLKNYELNQLHELIGSLSFHDFYTYDHSINVSMYCILLYRLFNPEASEDDVVNAGMGGFLHDIGKIKISNRILNKVGKLNDEEFQEIRNHPEYGRELLEREGVKVPVGSNVEIIRRVVFQHHENFDGSGYPGRISGEKIHVYARITAIADFFDAITTKRSYAEVLRVSEALDLMKKNRGKKLDPALFDLFFTHMNHHYGAEVCPIDLSPDFDPCQPHVRLKRAE